MSVFFAIYQIICRICHLHQLSNHLQTMKLILGQCSSVLISEQIRILEMNNPFTVLEAIEPQVSVDWLNSCLNLFHFFPTARL